MSESAAKAAEDLQRDKHFRWSTNKDVTRSLREMDTADDERRSQNAESVKGSLEKRGAHEETRQTDTQKDATHTREKNSMADAASRTVTCLKATERLETYHHTRERVPAHATFPAVDEFGYERDTRRTDRVNESNNDIARLAPQTQHADTLTSLRRRTVTSQDVTPPPTHAAMPHLRAPFDHER
eukprot:GEMP01100416.1.p1 GENE.GEMP01100416.1~~GEMP01100416.1.p1  ORF type:complete len:184 (+),score=57.66 GEMP01100416.1:154-705(+)